jgi:ribosomal-protein-alanine N-acetyltransferase
MSNQIVRGEKMFLRPMSESDINSEYVSWFADQEVTSFLNARNINLESAQKFFRYGIETKEHVQLAICDTQTDRMIGSVKIGPIDKMNRTSDLVTIIGNRNYWGKGYAKEAIRLASGYAFQYLNIRKLSGGIISGNIGSIKSYTGGGWLVEGILLGHYIQGTEVQDRVVISCFNPNYFSEEVLAPTKKFSNEWLTRLSKK